MGSSEQSGDRFGAHRVIAPVGALPQAAERLDNDFARSFDCEILIDVDTLNIDAASFRQLSEAAGGDAERVGEAVLAIVAARGKQHNPVTGSGGMLLGTIARIGSAVQAELGSRASSASVGDRVASLVSLTLTPLRLDAIRAVRMASAQIDVRGQAVLFASGPFAVLPTDLPERVSLAALDVCGAPALVARSAEPGERVLVLGAGGKSGLLCSVQARRAVGAAGRVVGVEALSRAAADLRALGVCDAVLELDARAPLALRHAALAHNDGREFDRVISCVNVEGAEMAAILCTRPRGRVVFFAMTTSFARAALGAEGVGKDVELCIGNGFAEGHAALTLELLRSHAPLRALFEQRYG
jgi:L-erythro-3,5-diaminohexanoate dehydrogenase